jgi:hypothetical protein
MKKSTLYLAVLVIMMVASLGAKAQGGLSPLVNSTHTYTVTPESGSNTLVWSVAPASGFTINSGASTASVNITWTTAGTYTLTFTETNGNSCSTVKTATVVVAANTFDVYTASPSATCNAADGQVNYASSTATTSITYTVNMTTGNASWSPNWEFAFTLTPSAGATIAGVTASAGTLSGTGPYVVTAIPSASGNKTMTVTMTVTGNIYTQHTVGLAITSAKELVYNTPDKDSDDHIAAQTINAVPNTSAISTD